jgi:FkbM family methyltransferase
MTEKRGYLHSFLELKGLFRTIRLNIGDELWWNRHKRNVKTTPFQFKLVGNEAMQSGDFENEERKLIEQFLPDTDLFVDVGANIGFFTCFARNAHKQVIAIEPVNFNLRSLFYNLKINRWDDVEVLPVGLGAAPGVATIYGLETAASLIDGWTGNTDKWAQRISINTLDNILNNRFKDKRIVVKIDVEGTEFNVLQGAGETLRRFPRPMWIFENILTHHINENHCVKNDNFVNVFNVFWENGYQTFCLDNLAQPITEADVDRWVNEHGPDKNISKSWNFLARAN